MFEYEANTDPVDQSKKVGRAFAQAHHEAERKGIKSFLFKSASVEEFDQRILIKDVASSLDDISEKYLNEVSDGRAKIARSIRKEYEAKVAAEMSLAKCPKCGKKTMSVSDKEIYGKCVDCVGKDIRESSKTAASIPLMPHTDCHFNDGTSNSRCGGDGVDMIMGQDDSAGPFPATGQKVKMCEVHAKENEQAGTAFRALGSTIASYKGIKYANKYIKKRGDQWVIIQKGTGKVLSHHDSESKAESAFRAMMQSKHGAAQPFHSPDRPDVGAVREDGAIWDDMMKEWHTCNPTGEEYDKCTRWQKGHMGPQLNIEPGDVVHSNYAPYDTENPDPNWSKGVVLDRRPDAGDHPGDNWYYAQFPHGVGFINSVRIHRVEKPDNSVTDVDAMKKKMWGWESSVKQASDETEIEGVDIEPKRGRCTCHNNPLTCQVHNPDVVPEAVIDQEDLRLKQVNPVSVSPQYEHRYLGLINGSIKTAEDLEEYWKKQADLVGPSAKNSPGPGISQNVPNTPTTDAIVNSNEQNADGFTQQNSTALCPHCGIPMTDSGGVDTCTQCGYTQQDWIDAENPIIRQYASVNEEDEHDEDDQEDEAYSGDF